MDINKKTLCKNYDCTEKYWCKRYCTQSNERYEDAIDLKEFCNKKNKHALMLYWKTNQDN